jgi:hypothetical protein
MDRGRKSEALTAGLDIHDCVARYTDIGTLAAAVSVEAAQEVAPFVLPPRRRGPSSDERCAIVRPSDAKKIAMVEIARLRLSERNERLRIEDRHCRLVHITDCDPPARRVDRDAGWFLTVRGGAFGRQFEVGAVATQLTVPARCDERTVGRKR